MAKRASPEDDLQIEAMQYLRFVLPSRAIAWHTVNESMAPPHYREKLKKKGLLPGIPDILILFDMLYGMELKHGTNTQTESQRIIESAFIANGSKYAVCRSMAEIEAQIKAWGLTKRQARHGV